jgi:hypothetical protein
MFPYWTYREHQYIFLGSLRDILRQRNSIISGSKGKIRSCLNFPAKQEIAETDEKKL